MSDPKQDAVATAVETEVRRIVGDVEREYGSERVYATVRLTWLEKPGELTCWVGLAGKAAGGYYAVIWLGTRVEAPDADVAWRNPRCVPRSQPKTASEAVAALKAARDAEIARRGTPQDRTEVFLPSGDRYAMDALLEKAEREKAERNRVERRAESGLHFVGSVKAPKQAAAWAERMILSGRSCSVHRRAEGWWALLALVRDAAYATHEWKAVIGS